MSTEYRYGWLEPEDALHSSHDDFFFLNFFLRDSGSRHYLCLGTTKSSCDVARYEFVNVDGKPSPKTQFIIKDCCGYTLMKLTPPELYYYMHLVYQRCIEEDEPQEEIEEFAKDLAYFRDVCGVRCDENGNPVLETPPEEQDDV